MMSVYALGFWYGGQLIVHGALLGDLCAKILSKSLNCSFHGNADVKLTMWIALLM